MHAVSINPTVASLTRQAAVVAPSPAVDRAPARRQRHPPTARLFVHSLRRALRSTTDMQLAATTHTPMGPVPAEVVLEGRSRRIAVLVGEAASEREVLLLVYGGFDAVYRVSEGDARQQYLAAVTLLEAAEPTLFKQGHARVAAMASVRHVHMGRTTLAAEGWDGCIRATLHRRRINRPGEWAAQFELSLAAPAV
ncbi:MAG: hypothetical protein JJ896_07330 [Rhodothermales bacterium]|nr:hypothetical protein [Rhodothermales bacterium]MBO6779450.1 hypothetical protein [Rhodothermales bacterium]